MVSCMIELGNKTNCCGCGACVTACPENALRFEPDENGFLYPSVNELLCIHCGLCSRVCAYQKKTARGSEKITYAADASGIKREYSASGGVFAGLAKSFLDSGGVVFGSVLKYVDGHLRIGHQSISQSEDLLLLQGSKYVQSAINQTYAEARDVLIQGKKVLFSGTPCQIAGLYGFLAKEYANLYTIDIVCHGVPSEQLFLDYIRHEEKKLNGKIVDFCFRDKSQGWKLHGKMTVVNRTGEAKALYFEPEESSYYQLFLNGYTYRENCYSCPYAGENRMGDLTLGDFWGIEIVQPELLKGNGGPLDEKEGISCLIVNTEKGQNLLRQSQNIRVLDSTFEKAQRYNGQLRSPSQLKPERETVLALYRAGYEKVEKWYKRRLAVVKARRSIRKAIPRPVKKVLRRMLQ